MNEKTPKNRIFRIPQNALLRKKAHPENPEIVTNRNLRLPHSKIFRKKALFFGGVIFSGAKKLPCGIES